MLYNPAAVALAGALMWCILRLVAPLEPVTPLVPGAVTYVIVCYTAFLVGCRLSNAMRGNRPLPAAEASIFDSRFPIRTFWWSAAIGVLGMSIRLFDRVVVRSIDYSINQLDIRDQLMATGGSLYGAVASVLLPFSFVPLILLFAFRRRAHGAGLWIVAIAIFTFPMLESLQVLSRSLALLTATLAFSAWACLRFGGNIFDRRVALTAIGGLLGLLLFSTTIFSSRLADMQFSLLDSVIQSGYAHTIVPNPSASYGMTAGSDVERGFYNSVVPNSQYYLHGLYEFGLLYNRSDTQIFGLGAYMFYPYVRVYDFIFGNEEISFNTYAYLRPGIFVTFFGELWVDFGWVGPLILLVLGYGISRLAALARQGRISVLPIYLFSISGIFYMPIANLLTGGSAFFIMHGFVLFSIFASFSPELSPRKRDDMEARADLLPRTS